MRELQSLSQDFRSNIKYFPEIITTSRRLIDAARILSIPTVVTEQYPKGLGHTVPLLKEGLAENTPIFDKTKVIKI